MAKVALVEAKPSRNNYQKLFQGSFEFDQFSLASDPNLSKVFKKDIDIDINIEDFEWVILVGSETLKHFTKNSSITEYSGRVVDDKFLPVINPAMIKFKPEAKKPWEESRDNIIGYITGSKQVHKISHDQFYGIQEKEPAMKFLQAALEAPANFIALDSETTGLYPRNGHMLGFSMSYEDDHGAYISTEVIDEEVEELMQRIFTKKQVVFHNAKFDLAFFEYHFGFEFPRFEDTMLMHYMLDENPGTHGLKQLALRYTKYGDYEKPMYEWMDEYRRKNRITKEDFTWDMIPFEIMQTYAAIDAAATFLLYQKFDKALRKNPRLSKVYDTILIPGCRFLTDIQDNGVPFDPNRLAFGRVEMQAEIDKAVKGLSDFTEIAKLEEDQGKPFNPNSTLQLRKLLFDYIGLEPTGKMTGTGADSTDAEVLGQLALQHPVPAHILEVRKNGKIKNTYLDKIIPQLDRDRRLRTNFNLHGTTSGRLSSSGKLNMQQLPRDNPIVKGCIRAKEGHQIVAMDLTTAEVYVAAALADDLELQDIFRQGGNFHSSIAHRVFRLDCEIDEVAEKYARERQAAKAVTFGIMYGAGPHKISEQVTKDGGSMSVGEARAVIDDYFGAFWKLKEWIESTKASIERDGYIYSPFGRKRRLPNVASDNKGVRGHEIRSGLNFVVQSAASDINLLGAIDMHSYIQTNKMKSRIFALVHDSILAEVPQEEVVEYRENLQRFIQMDRGIYISGAPVGCDFDVGEDYSMGKFVKQYGDKLQTLGIS